MTPRIIYNISEHVQQINMLYHNDMALLQLHKNYHEVEGANFIRNWALNTSFRTSVDAWVAHLLRGSLTLYFYTTKNAQVGRSTPRWVAPLQC